jgi:hypothetical protein
MTMDAKDFYLNTPMERYECIHIPVEMIPTQFMTMHGYMNCHKQGASPTSSASAH